ncbi:MAG: MAPEG family protein, partial [Pseudomonadota bacterium]
MTPELTALTLAALLQVLQFGLMSVAANRDLGPGKTMSARDESRLGGSLQSQLSD